jgi:hypothetical protein
MRTLVHDTGAAAGPGTGAGPRPGTGAGTGAARLAGLGLSAADFEFVLAGADAEARTWTTLAPPLIAGIARWGKTNELLRVRLLPRGWTRDDPRNMPRTISPAGDTAIVAATGDGATGRPDVAARNLYARGHETARAIGRGDQLAFPYPGLEPPPADDLDIWLLLYHPAGDEIRAELSRPCSISTAGYVDCWAERILLPPIPLGQPASPGAGADLTVPVTRRAP